MDIKYTVIQGAMAESSYKLKVGGEVVVTSMVTVQSEQPLLQDEKPYTASVHNGGTKCSNNINDFDMFKNKLKHNLFTQFCTNQTYC